MRGATHARWIAGAAAVALAATACGGGDDDSGGSSGSGDSGAVLSSSWGDPQNPLERPTPTRCRAARCST